MAAHTETPETRESFGHLMTDTLYAGFRLSGIALGLKLGLFKAFDDVAVTSEVLAKRAKCKERYVREWLHHMVMCDVVDVDPTGRLFSLPGHRRDILTGDSNVITGMGTTFPAMHIPHREILSCFREDGPEGLPFDTVLPFFAERALVNSGALANSANVIRDGIPGLKDKLESGARVCEVGTGNAGLLLHLASQFPRSTFVGVDTSRPLLDLGRAEADRRGLTNLSLEDQDAADLPTDWADTMDLVILRDVLHDLPHVSRALGSLYRVIRPGGQLSVTELNLAANPYDSRRDASQKAVGQISYVTSVYHCLPASLGVPGSDGLGNGAGVTTLLGYVKGAGFVVETDPEPVDMFNVHIVARKPAK